MAQIIIDIAMSLDGYIAGPNDRPGNGLGDGGDRVHAWDNSKRQLFIDAEHKRFGAMIAGRRTYDNAEAWGGTHELQPGIPVFVLSETKPDNVPEGETEFVFVSDGIESAAQQARQAAGDKLVYVIGGANVIQQLLNKRLADELRIHIVPMFMGDGIRLFEGLDPELTLKQGEVSDFANVTHITYSLR